ncbi:MAG: threonine synthase [Termitinemataceae bacterium]|nr:MAG: threonine synthase [Termitinemataceae bacterium]
MKYFSTKDKSSAVSFAEALFCGLAKDGGLFVPQAIPEYSSAVKSSLATMSFLDVAFETIKPYVEGEIPDGVLQEIVASAYTFSAPLVHVKSETSKDRYVLELFHGPTAAFKDFGARFMARAFAYLRRGETRTLKILVATSGDTGGAVADGFFGVEGISVTVLYPKGRVSPLQERQIAGLGGNISAIAVDGSFDDCQALVKAAFKNEELKKRLDLSSANSINIARLIPQTIYYSAASGKKPGLCFSVPSGNFGNLTAGLYAQKMGAPISKFIAATNINKTFPEYLESGKYEEKKSVATISNAMDVGAPSNFERMKSHFSLEQMRSNILSTFITDDETRLCIKKVYAQSGYILDPHGAVGFCAADRYLNDLGNTPIAVLATAASAKFRETVEPLIGCKIPLPQSLEAAMKREVNASLIKADLNELCAML